MMTKEMMILVRMTLVFCMCTSVYDFEPLHTSVYLDLYDELQAEEESDDHNWVPGGKYIFEEE